jgi:signal transduction histidine kinase
MTSLNAGDAAAILERFDARAVIQDVVKRYERTLREKGLRLELDTPEREMPVTSDRAKVERIFHNVFNNAVKFTPQGAISVKASPSVDRTSIEIEVSDTGIGIEKNKMDSIFEPFQQADVTRQRGFSGLGLGLTVARRMTELIGGTLDVTSQPNVGTRVAMKFPSQSAAASQAPLEQRRYG